MAVKCPKCRKEYDISLFESGKEIICVCGTRLGLEHEEIFKQIEKIRRKYHLGIEEEKLVEIRRAQDKIVVLILNSDYPKVDVEIEMAKFRDLIKKIFPEKVHLYEMIYEARFRRLWEQFRET